MSTQKPADTLNIKGIVSGFGKQVLDGSGRNVLLPVENGYEYMSGIVVDVIADPKIYFSNPTRKNSLFNTLSPDDQNFNMIEKAPKNSIVCQIIDLGQNEYSANQIICFPFFPPHFSLPIKPSEHVWIVKETTGDISRYYWMCRKHSSYHVENLNLNTHEREIATYDTMETFKDKKIKLNNNTVRVNNFDFPGFARAGIGIPSLDPENIVKNSHAFQTITTEPVPELSKNCSDLLLQGSNNAVIHLTQEKFSIDTQKTKERYPPESYTGENNQNNANENRSPFSPAIDICVARKKKELSAAKSLIEIRNEEEDLSQFNDTSPELTNVEVDGMHFIKNFRKDSSIETYEINKMPEILDSTETEYNSLQDYDVDFKNCGARIYLSNNCNIDDVLNVGSPNDADDIIFEKFDGATFSTYAEHTRFITDGTFRIVNNFKNEEKDTVGSTYIEIDNTGKVSIGSLNGDVASEGGVTGMQSFVKGEELEALLQRLIEEITSMIDNFNSNFQSNTTPGFGAPNLVLSAILPPILESHKTKFNGIKEELDKFKSKLIRGE